MQTLISGKSPSQWLADTGLPAHKIDEILASYDSGAMLRLYTYRAPHLFVRFHGSESRRAIHQPNYWADGSAIGSAFGRTGQFEGFLTDKEINQVAKTYDREITAICHNWNPLDSEAVWKIELRGAETMEGLAGPVAPQPTHAANPATSEPASMSTLTGGAIQVYLNPKTPFICTPVSW